jgi:hypothetical protein
LGKASRNPLAQAGFGVLELARGLPLETAQDRSNLALTGAQLARGVSVHST